MVAAGALAFSGAPAQAQESPEYRVFTDKQGRSLEARMVAVSPDRKFLKIRLRDGKEVDLEILLLSLDDQQFLRGWVSSQPVSTNHRLQVTVEKTSAQPSDRRRESSYRMTTDHVAYRIRVTNLSRETLSGAVVEYGIVNDEGIQIFQDEDTGRWDFSSNGSDDFNRTLVLDKGELPDLVYNREEIVSTKPVEVDQVIGDGNFIYGEDKLVGAMVRVLDQAGNVIGTWRSSDAGIGRIEWDEITELAADDTDPDGLAATAERRRFRLEKGETLPPDAWDLVGRSVTVITEIVPDGLAPDGVIASHGGPDGGWALLVKDRKVVFLAKCGSRLPKSVSMPLPDGTAPIAITARYTDVLLELEVNDLPPVTEDSPGLLEVSPTEGFSAGFEIGEPVSAAYSAPFPFAGTISDLTVRLGVNRPDTD